MNYGFKKISTFMALVFGLALIFELPISETAFTSPSVRPST